MQKTTPAPLSRDRGADLVRVGHLAPLVRDALHVEPVLLADRDPALAERAGGDDGDPVAGAAQVRDRGLHRARAGGARRAAPRDSVRKTSLQPRERALVDVAEVGAAVVHHRLGHRREHLGRHGRRARREQVALLHSFSGYLRADSTPTATSAAVTASSNMPSNPRRRRPLLLEDALGHGHGLRDRPHAVRHA